MRGGGGICGLMKCVAGGGGMGGTGGGASKIALLPSSQKLKQQVASSLLVGSAAWGKTLSHDGLDEAQNNHLRNFRKAVFGHSGSREDRLSGCPNDRAPPLLQQLLILGHMSDIRFVITTRWLSTVSRWLAFRAFSRAKLEDVKPHLTIPVGEATKQLRLWGFQETNWGVWRDDRDHQFSFDMPKPHREAAMHFLRHGWRKFKLRSWPATIRNDAAAARHTGLGGAIDNQLIDKLRALFKSAVGSHERGVILGSMRTSASVPGVILGPRILGALTVRMPLENMSCGSVQRPAYAHLRRLPPPACELGQRLGWSPSLSRTESQKLVSQMAATRKTH